MLKIITNPGLINGSEYLWDEFNSGDDIDNIDIVLDPAAKLMLTVLADSNASCRIVDNIQFPINFKNAEKVLISPRKDGKWKGVIALRFNKPVFAAGARIGVAGLGSPRDFKAMIRAYDTDGKEVSDIFNTTSTNVQDNSAKFLGAISSGAKPSLMRIEFDAEPIIGSTLFAKFAISTLVYQSA